jgi:hypothetical protein
MNYSIRTYPHFDKALKHLAKRYQSLKQDLLRFSDSLLSNSEQGVDLGNGIHKVRMSISSKGKGKRGGARVITLILSISDSEKEIGLHFIYDKSERESISEKEIKEIIKDHGIF